MKLIDVEHTIKTSDITRSKNVLTPIVCVCVCVCVRVCMCACMQMLFCLLLNLLSALFFSFFFYPFSYIFPWNLPTTSEITCIIGSGFKIPRLLQKQQHDLHLSVVFNSWCVSLLLPVCSGLVHICGIALPEGHGSHVSADAAWASAVRLW